MAKKRCSVSKYLETVEKGTVFAPSPSIGFSEDSRSKARHKYKRLKSERKKDSFVG
jgi:hypothetical protein